MKKLILSAAVLAFLAACGSGEKKDKKGSETDTTKTDTTKTTDNAPKVKDYAYYLNQFKNFKLEGVDLTQYNLYEDTAGKSINIIYRVNNADAVGYNEVVLNTSTCSRLIGDDKAKCETYNMESFSYFMNIGRSKKDQLACSEYKSGETTFYYCTVKNIKGSMGSKDYNQMIIETKSGEFILNGRVNVNDLKSDMVKAEAGLKLVADYLAQ